MQILVVAGFVVVMALADPPGGGAAAAPAGVLLSLAAAYVAAAYAATRANASLGLRRLARSPDGCRAGRATVLAARGTQVYLVAALAALMLMGWGTFLTRALHLEAVPRIGRLAAAAPFVAALLAHWWAMYPLERAMRARLRRQLGPQAPPAVLQWSRGQFLRFNVRHHLLFVAVPVVIIVLVIDLLELLRRAKLLSGHGAALAGLAVGGAVFVAAPAIIVRIWRTRPMPDGPLRRRLEALCGRLGLTYRRILIWDTGGGIVNAGVLGFLRPMRYVLLSDALLTHLDDDAVEVIFAHEAGHVVHRHIPYMIVFTSGLLLVCAAAGPLLARAVGLGRAGAEVLMLVLAAGLWGWLFGMLSRRFERQADVFAAAAAGGDPGGALNERGVDLFARALASVGWLNGIAPTRRSFRHGSIQLRVAYLWGLFRDAAGPPQIDRRIWRVKLAVWALLVLGFAVAVAF